MYRAFDPLMKSFPMHPFPVTFSLPSPSHDKQELPLVAVENY